MRTKTQKECLCVGIPFLLAALCFFRNISEFYYLGASQTICSRLLSPLLGVLESPFLLRLRALIMRPLWPWRPHTNGTAPPSCPLLSCVFLCLSLSLILGHMLKWLWQHLLSPLPGSSQGSCVPYLHMQSLPFDSLYKCILIPRLYISSPVCQHTLN